MVEQAPQLTPVQAPRPEIESPQDTRHKQPLTAADLTRINTAAQWGERLTRQSGEAFQRGLLGLPDHVDQLELAYRIQATGAQLKEDRRLRAEALARHIRLLEGAAAAMDRAAGEIVRAEEQLLGPGIDPQRAEKSWASDRVYARLLAANARSALAQLEDDPIQRDQARRAAAALAAQFAQRQMADLALPVEQKSGWATVQDVLRTTTQLRTLGQFEFTLQDEPAGLERSAPDTSFYRQLRPVLDRLQLVAQTEARTVAADQQLAGQLGQLAQTTVTLADTVRLAELLEPGIGLEPQRRAAALAGYRVQLQQIVRQMQQLAQREVGVGRADWVLQGQLDLAGSVAGLAELGGDDRLFGEAVAVANALGQRLFETQWALFGTRARPPQAAGGTLENPLGGRYNTWAVLNLFDIARAWSVRQDLLYRAAQRGLTVGPISISQQRTNYAQLLKAAADTTDLRGRNTPDVSYVKTLAFSDQLAQLRAARTEQERKVETIGSQRTRPLVGYPNVPASAQKPAPPP